MNDNAWKPDPELLAAYFDGELEGRDEVADLRTRVEAWLEANPQAAEQWGEHQELKKLWVDTTPAEPSAAAWKQTFERIDAERRQPSPAPRRRFWLIASVVAASVLLFVGLLVGAFRSLGTPQENKQLVQPPRHETPGDDLEILEVALSSEITIFRIDTDDIESVIVGTMPVNGPLELVDAGEACISCKCPRVFVRQEPPARPMVWAVASGD